MPGRNILKIDAPDSYYHVYTRGSNKQLVFLDEYDYRVFFSLLKRYLSEKPTRDKSGRAYPHFRGEIELLSYCLMPNHVHLLFYQNQPHAMSNFMRSLMASYSRHFNDTHERSGPLFSSRYRASMITNDTYLQHISRYIHLNPDNWRAYPYSSIHSYVGQRHEEWLQPQRILDLFPGRKEYIQFVRDYNAHKKALNKIQHALADT